MNKKKICIVVTTRGNYAKIKSLLGLIQEDDSLELQIIAAGGAILNRYGNIGDALKRNGVKVDRHIHYIVEGENLVAMAKSSGLVVNEFSSAFEDLAPDMVLVIADRYECLPLAMTAAYMNICVVHMEGGEVSGSIDESIRHAISKLSHIHFPATEGAAKRLVRLGENTETVFPVGATSLDIINELNLYSLDSVMQLQKESGVGHVLDLASPYLVVIQHPVTTEYKENLAHINETICAVNDLEINTIWIWPNMDAGSDGISKGIRLYHETVDPQFVHFFRGLAIEHYAPLLKNAACIVGNSSSGIREAGFMGTPSVNIGSRQNDRERCHNVLDVGYDCEEIKRAISFQLRHGPYEPDFTYGDGRASIKIIDILKDCDVSLQKKITY